MGLGRCVVTHIICRIVICMQNKIFHALWSLSYERCLFISLLMFVLKIEIKIIKAGWQLRKLGFKMKHIINDLSHGGDAFCFIKTHKKLLVVSNLWE